MHQEPKFSTAGSALDAGNEGAFRAEPSTTRPNSESWALKPGLAAEYLNAVRNVFPGSQQYSTDGHVHHEAVQYTSKQSNTVTSSQAGTIRGQAALGDLDETSSKDDLARDKEIRLEAERVQAKFMYGVDTSTNVILRFNFMTNRDTRVKQCISKSSNDLTNRDVQHCSSVKLHLWCR